MENQPHIPEPMENQLHVYEPSEISQIFAHSQFHILNQLKPEAKSKILDWGIKSNLA
jgi:hypothetical protein